MNDVPEGPVAYCAPGQKAAAADILEENGEMVTRIKEHPWLTGPAVYVVYPEAFRPLSDEMPWMEPPEFGSPEWWRESHLRSLREFAAAGSDAGSERRTQGDGHDRSTGEHSLEDFI